MTLAEIQEILNNTDMEHYPHLNISILRNIILEPIEPYLRYSAYEMGFNAKIVFGEYDNVYQEVIGGNKQLLVKDTDVIMVFLKLDTLSWDLSRNYPALNAEKIQSEVVRIKEYIKHTISGIRGQTDAMILWHGFELPVFPAMGILDIQNSRGQLALISNLNEYTKTQLQDKKNAYFVDLNLCLTRIGFEKFYDFRYWHIGRAPYSREALKEIASEDFKFIRPLKGKNKKCLVMDCDNTLWGGIIGEDGLKGIQLSKNYPGSAYYELQQEVLNLYHRGVILALCSKNNGEDVWEVFQKHPDMILKEEHIAAAQINWSDKVANLKQIAMDLNIGLDTMVFMDDSEFEINLIRKMLPEVEVIHLPQQKAIEYRNILASCGFFDTLTISEEDRMRGAMYKAETNRKKLQVEAPDMINYYRSLEMELEIRFPDEFTIPRVAQLTQKTNQFNLTTRRYSESEIKGLLESNKADVSYVRLKDKFGDSGITGCCIMRYDGEKAIIDSFLLSCRVIGRGVESAFLVHALKLAKKRGCKVIIGEYYATRKNKQVEHFYKNHGFEEIIPNPSSADGCFQYKLETELKPEPEFFKKIYSDINEKY